MPIATCKNCHRCTNSVTSDYWAVFSKQEGRDPITPTKCYAAFVDGKWVRGCAFEQADAFERRFALGLIER